MELGRPGCSVDWLPDSPWHEGGVARCLLWTGAKPEVWCDWSGGRLYEVSCHNHSTGTCSSWAHDDMVTC